MVDRMAKRGKSDREMSQQVKALTPDVLRRQIEDLQVEAARYRATADEMDARVAKLQKNLETLERGEMPAEELRVKIFGHACVDGWITIPRVARLYPAVPIHQIERAVAALEREHKLERTDETEPTHGERGRPATKYALVGDEDDPEEDEDADLSSNGAPPPTPTPRKRGRTRETPRP